MLVCILVTAIATVSELSPCLLVYFVHLVQVIFCALAECYCRTPSVSTRLTIPPVSFLLTSCKSGPERKYISANEYTVTFVTLVNGNV